MLRTAEDLPEIRLTKPGYSELVLIEAQKLELINKLKKEGENSEKNRKELNKKHLIARENKYYAIKHTIAETIVLEATNLKVDHLLKDFNNDTIALMRDKAIERLSKDSKDNFLMTMIKRFNYWVKSILRKPLYLFILIPLAVFSVMVTFLTIMLDKGLEKIVNLFINLGPKTLMNADSPYIFLTGPVILVICFALIGCLDVVDHKKIASKISRLKRRGMLNLTTSEIKEEVDLIQHPPAPVNMERI